MWIINVYFWKKRPWERVRVWEIEWCCIIWLASTVDIMSIFMLRALLLSRSFSLCVCLSIQRVIGYQIIYWTFNRTNPASHFILRLCHVNYSSSLSYRMPSNEPMHTLFDWSVGSSSINGVMATNYELISLSSINVVPRGVVKIQFQ